MPYLVFTGRDAKLKAWVIDAHYSGPKEGLRPAIASHLGVPVEEVTHIGTYSTVTNAKIVADAINNV